MLQGFRRTFRAEPNDAFELRLVPGYSDRAPSAPDRHEGQRFRRGHKFCSAPLTIVPTRLITRDGSRDNALEGGASSATMRWNWGLGPSSAFRDNQNPRRALIVALHSSGGLDVNPARQSHKFARHGPYGRVGGARPKIERVDNNGSIMFLPGKHDQRISHPDPMMGGDGVLACARCHRVGVY